MTLEDFFTLTEMKDGLTAPSRVHELVSVMQKEKDCVVRNTGDATRQWAAVASTIAATENKDCLDLFIQLDGLCFIDKWLKDARSYGSETSDSFVEESITALLRAVEKLQIDKERSISSGIHHTVYGLLGHSSSQIQDTASALFDRWKQDKVSDAFLDIQSVGSSGDGSVLPDKSNEGQSVAIQVSNSKASTVSEASAAEFVRDDELQAKNTNGFEAERCGSSQTPTDGSIQDKPQDAHTSPVTSDIVHESPLAKENLLVSTLEATGTVHNHKLSVSKIDNLEPQSPTKPSNFPYKSDVTLNNAEVEPGVDSCNATSSPSNLVEPTCMPIVKSEESEFCAKGTALEDHGKPTVAPNVESVDVGAINRCNIFLSVSTTAMDKQSFSKTLHDSADHDTDLDKHNVGTSFSRTENIGASDDFQEESSDEAEDLKDVSVFAGLAMHKHSPGLADHDDSDSELGYGVVDALEVARQVAQEVERVVDYREQSCSSSSEKILKTAIRPSCSPDSVSRKQEILNEVQTDDVPTGQSQNAEACSKGDAHFSSSVCAEVENGENGTNEPETSHFRGVTQETGVNNKEKCACGFDLNQEVPYDEMDQTPNPLSAPISFVSASRPIAALGLPATRLQFQGSHGWKGSSATSAFRPASPCKISDGDKTFESVGTSDSSREKQNGLDIDLNMTEDEDEKTTGFLSARQLPSSSVLHSRESSMEMEPRRSERPNLDLNRISDDDALPSDFRVERQLFPRNHQHSPSPASSTSSRQHSVRNFDLNDGPLFLNDSSHQGFHHGKPSQNAGFLGGLKAGEPVISLFGAKVEVGGRMDWSTRDHIPAVPALTSGKPLQPTVDFNDLRMGAAHGMVPTVSCAHTPVFGYNGLAATPTISMAPGVYGSGGSIPYMLDSRGAPVMPQIMGSSSTMPPPYSQPPFIMGMTGTPLALSNAGHSRPNFDLNSGFAIEGANSVGIRQLFMPGPLRSMEEHFGNNSQQSLSFGSGAKRKEPDGGWEPYLLHYKHPQPPSR